MRSSDPLVTIENGNWGATDLRAIGALLQSAASVLCDAFGRRPDASVLVSPWDQPPMVAWDKRAYRIWISARDTYWCQYAYQFSHELCQLLVNFGRLGHHRHKWFEESICELSALFVLHRLSEEFRQAPPSEVLGAEEFAPHFATYAEEVASSARRVRRAELPVWFSMNVHDLEERRVDRDLNRIVAVALLDSFVADRSLWRDCGSLNLWNAAEDRTFADHLDSWATCLRAKGVVPQAPPLVRSLFFATPGPEV